MSEVVRSLFVTLRRGLAGKPWPHRRVVEALGLTRRHDCVEKPNNASIRGMLGKVPHLVIVETDKMYYYRCMRDYYEGLCRPPISVQHPSLPEASSSSYTTAGLPLPTHPQQHTQHTQSRHQEHVLPEGMEGYAALHRPKRPIKHLREHFTRERVRVLSERGLYSQKVALMNVLDISRSHAEHQARKRPGRAGSGSTEDVAQKGVAEGDATGGEGAGSPGEQKG